MSFPSTLLNVDLYELGLAQRDSGNWQEALRIWQMAKDSLPEQTATDPRIGLAFIELATQKKAADYYENASKMYFWGFSQANAKIYKEEIRQEIDRLSAILGDEESNRWLKLVEDGDSAINNEIKCFWVRKDPIPTTEKNERLIEHWQRLAHVKEKYLLEKTTVYGTDDRGMVYVKYGEPDVIYAGKLGEGQVEIIRWLDDFMLRQEIQRFNNIPELEIWLYKNLDSEKSTIYLFGKRTGFGKYGLRYGIEDFISDQAFRRNSTQTTRGVLPGAMLQLIYYSELIQVDRFFVERYRELEAMWSNARAAGYLSPNYDVIRGLVNHYKNIDKDRLQFKYMPLDQTNAFEGLETLSLKYKQFRYLDNQHKSRLYLMTVSAAQSNDGLDFTHFFREATMSKYKQRHILITYDNNWDVKDRVINYPAANNLSTSTHSIIQTTDSTNYLLVAEKIFLDARTAKIEESDISDTAKVLGIGTAFLGKIEPLSPDTTSFEVSDLILGIKSPSHIDDALLYPFPVIPKDPVRHSESLQIYLELYHLAASRDNKTAFRLDCDINRIKEKGKSKKKKESLSVSCNFEAYDRNTKKIFELNISNLIPGDYEITLKALDKNSQKSKIRKSMFRIVS